MDLRMGPTEPHVRVLAQAVELLKCVDDEIYSAGSPLCPGGSVGRHLRHCLDFYASFRDGLAEGMIDYTRRDRDTSIERRRAVGVRRLRETIAYLDGLRVGVHRPVFVRNEGEVHGGDAGWSRSTVARELEFLLCHSVHHFALAAVMLRIHGVEPHATFGVASSTLRHLGQARRSAR